MVAKNAGLNFVLKAAVTQIKHMTLIVDQTTFSLSLSSAITWFKITEKLLINGAETVNRRRDFRRGKTFGYVQAMKDSFVVRSHWDDPLAGTGTDTLRLEDDNTLIVEYHVIMPGEGKDFRWMETWRKAT